jgi:SAM-dependent methyltransferase
MGSPNQLLFIQRHAQRLCGPYLEVGAKDYGSTEDLRPLFAAKGRYVGVDLESGPGVDLVLDMAGPFELLDAALAGARFGTIFCLSILEHCRQPFQMAENLTRLLAPQGRLVVAAPFAFKFHAYPNDYWRFTPEGIRALFAGLDFPAEEGAVATSITGHLTPLDKELGRIVFGYAPHRKEGRRLRGAVAKALALAAKAGVLRWLAGYRYVLPPTEILLIGTLREKAPCPQASSGP